MPNILRAKCIVVGDQMVGKTAMINAFLSENEKFQKNYVMTCGVDIKTKLVSVPDTDDAVELLLFDSSGKDTYQHFQLQMWQNPSMVCVVFDLTNENSFAGCSRWLDAVRNLGRYFTIPGVLIGTKNDLTDRRVVKTNDVHDYAKKNYLQYFECSSKENIGVEEPFFYLVNEWHKMYLEKTDFFKTVS